MAPPLNGRVCPSRGRVAALDVEPRTERLSFKLVCGVLRRDKVGCLHRGVAEWHPHDESGSPKINASLDTRNAEKDDTLPYFFRHPHLGILRPTEGVARRIDLPRVNEHRASALVSQR